MQWLGVDIGGTFTDCVVAGADGLRYHKLPSTPDHYGAALLAGAAALGCDQGKVRHGSTVATNALLERRGACCGLLTTAGFADLLAIGRQDRASLYDLAQPLPEPLVPAALRLGIPERVGPCGELLRPLDEAAATAAIDRLMAAGAESVAVVFLFGWLHPEHERRVAELAAKRGLYVSAAVDVLAEFREYERAATTVINAYVGPLMSRYLERLQARLSNRSLAVMQSNGGCIEAAMAGREAVRTVLSGPAAGVVGAWQTAAAAGVQRVVTFDMGGTSTDVAVCDGGLPLTRETHLAGLPVGVPTLAIHTVGAGGGSLARRDAGGALAVGPESAGAAPGPACYGRGGNEPTVTDANLALGRLVPARFLGGRMPLDRDAATAAVDALADELGLSREACALGIVRVAESAMERAIRVISVERGLDPRGFALLSFGGAGGLHAVSLARRLRLREVIVPPHAGMLSALGLLLSELVRDAAVTQVGALADWTADSLRDQLAALAAPEIEALADSGGEITVSPAVDLRYAGQSFELTIPADDPSPDRLATAFAAAHHARYGFRRDAAAVELVTVRVRVSAATPRPELTESALGEPDPSAALVGRQRVRFERWLEAPIYDLEALRPGMVVDHPALLAGEDTTVLVPAGVTARVDGWGNVRLAWASLDRGAG